MYRGLPIVEIVGGETNVAGALTNFRDVHREVRTMTGLSHRGAWRGVKLALGLCTIA